MTSISKEEASAERTRAIAFPAIAAILIFALIAYIQFSTFLGQYGFIAQLPLGIAFYYCWAWHVRLSKRAEARAAQLKK
jgi:fatty acid desaturase